MWTEGHGVCALPWVTGKLGFPFQVQSLYCCVTRDACHPSGEFFRSEMKGRFQWSLGFSTLICMSLCVMLEVGFQEFPMVRWMKKRSWIFNSEQVGAGALLVSIWLGSRTSIEHRSLLTLLHCKEVALRMGSHFFPQPSWIFGDCLKF